MSLLDNLLHLGFQFIEILSGERLGVEVIVKSLLDCRSDCHLRIRKQALDSLCEHMGCRVADNLQPLRVVCRHNIELTVLRKLGAQIDNLTVYLPGTRRARQTLADIFRDVIN